MEQAFCHWIPKKSLLHKREAALLNCELQSQAESANARGMCIAPTDNKLVLAAGMNNAPGLDEHPFASQSRASGAFSLRANRVYRWSGVG